MAKFILGFVGEMGAGKGFAAQLVKSWHPDTPSFRFSDVLREWHRFMNEHIGGKYGVTISAEASTPDLQAYSTKFRELFGEDVLERAIMTRLAASKAESPFVVLDGIRRPSDIAVLSSDPAFRLIYIDAVPLIRWRRHVARAEKPGDAKNNLLQFIKLCKAEPEAQIPSLKPMAHMVLTNNATEEEFADTLRSHVVDPLLF